MWLYNESGPRTWSLHTVTLANHRSTSSTSRLRYHAHTHRVASLQQDLETATAAVASSAAAAAASPTRSAGTSPSNAVATTTRLRSMEKRINAQSIKLEAARNEARHCRTALAAELGDDADIDAIISGIASGEQAGTADPIGGWRGRAQTIIKLKAALRRANRELQKAQAEAGTVPPVLSAANQRDVDYRAEAALAQASAAKAAEKEELERALADAESAAEGARQKLSKARARLSVVESDAKRTKEQLGTVLDKTQHDDELIDALRAELERLQNVLAAERSAARADRRSGTHMSTRSGSTQASAFQVSVDGDAPMDERDAAAEIARLRALVSQSSRQASQQERKIESLQQQIAEMRASGKAGSRAGPGRSSRPSSADVKASAVAEVAALEHATRNKMLVAQTAQLQELLNTREQRLAEAQELAQAYMDRAGGLEARCRALDEQLAAANGKRARKPSEAATLAAQLATVSNENEALKQQHAAQLAAMEADIDRLRSGLREVMAQFESYAAAVQEKLPEPAADSQADQVDALPTYSARGPPSSRSRDLHKPPRGHSAGSQLPKMAHRPAATHFEEADEGDDYAAGQDDGVFYA